ncbi:Transposase DDE domain-containing protein [Sedimentitalea nanhaiensis]|uniref:Transposase DDE domain-containing protein n=1 Tax=Sedimentitalea nanhaiensis TaxID=999627 RepID=A0A1I7AJM5_9RHOB|nr:Transposase DDE domain-containing protein [Sedimentitalea nanhaiensis]
MAGLEWPVPDFSTLSRRQKSITIEISSRRSAGPLNLLVDSTGIKFLGDGEWLARKHRTHRRRQYRKVHLAMDTGSGDVVAVEFTSSREGDSPVLPDLLDQIPVDQEIGTVTGDGAFDTRRCHTAILARGGTAVIPIRKNGRFWKEDSRRAMSESCVPDLNARAQPWARISMARRCGSGSGAISPAMILASTPRRRRSNGAVMWARAGHRFFSGTPSARTSAPTSSSRSISPRRGSSGYRSARTRRMKA